LELTGTIEKRKMKEQFLDQMDLERERGNNDKAAASANALHSLPCVPSGHFPQAGEEEYVVESYRYSRSRLILAMRFRGR